MQRDSCFCKRPKTQLALASVGEDTAKSDECQLYPGYRSAPNYWESVYSNRYCLARGISPTDEWTETVGIRPVGPALPKTKRKPVLQRRFRASVI